MNSSSSHFQQAQVVMNSSTTGFRRRSKRGFTLVEVMIAGLVMAMGLASAFLIVQMGLSNLDNARVTTLVTQVLQDEAERIRLLNWSAVNSLPSSTTISLPPQFEETIVGGGQITVERAVANISGYSEAKEITLTATWSGITGIDYTRTMFLRYARGGLYDYYYGTNPES